MILDVPAYLRSVNQDPSIRYKWDDWNEEQADQPVDDAVLARLRALSQRAVVAFTTATAEWIVHRFATLADVTAPSQFLEMAWANIVDFNYCAMTWEDYHDSSEWVGPVKRPLAIAMERVDNAFQAIIGDQRPEIRAALLTNLAQYVVPDPKPYLDWRARVMERFEALYRRDAADPLGDVVPRQALDPDRPFDPRDTERQVNEFLARLRGAANPFLNSSEDMLAQGFLGEPYRFDMEADRINRVRGG